MVLEVNVRGKVMPVSSRAVAISKLLTRLSTDAPGTAPLDLDAEVFRRWLDDDDLHAQEAPASGWLEVLQVRSIPEDVVRRSRGYLPTKRGAV